jgi:hypothetical protein
MNLDDENKKALVVGNNLADRNLKFKDQNSLLQSNFPFQ